mmetsp:Transcript_20763/g.39495  ORF Transcript_20763/g.39495 Transcript_20763/m.39495 type:complete len:83 (-) Transcript_20763:284-532(-)
MNCAMTYQVFLLLGSSEEEPDKQPHFYSNYKPDEQSYCFADCNPDTKPCCFADCDPDEQSHCFTDIITNLSFPANVMGPGLF